MENQKQGLDGIQLVAIKDGQPVPNQAEAVIALMRPLVAAVLKHSDDRTGSAAYTTPKTTEERNRRISDLEIECATLRHGLRLAERRHDELMEANAGLAASYQAYPANSGKPEQEVADPVTGEWRRPAIMRPNDAELRRAVKEITRMLNDREWAEHISGEPDASALEAAITKLVGEVTEGSDLGPVSGIPMSQEPKYGIRGGQLVNRASGEPIPANEPVFIFRARDRKALSALHFYAGVCDNPEHVVAVQDRIADFQAFAKREPSSMKQPDTDLSVLDKLNKLSE